MKHTPTPYTTNGVEVRDANGWIIATVEDFITSHPEGTERPIFTFVRLCNHHEELVEALENCIDRLARIDAIALKATDNTKECELGEVVQARSILAKVKACQ